jgi:amino acid transporter
MLKREIGPVAAAMLALNGMIGAGIFALPATVYGRYGGFAPWLFPLFGALVFLIAVPLAALAARFPESGGPAAYARAAFGPFASFQIGWTYYAARTTALAANAVVFADYAARFAPDAGAGLVRHAVIVAAILLPALLNMAGVGCAARSLNIVSLLKVAPLAALGVFGLIFAGGITPASPPPANEIAPAALLVLYAFIGFEQILVPAGETRNVARTIPAALLAALGGTALLYFLVVAGYAAVMGGAAAASAPLAAMGEKLFGPAGGVAILAVALVSLAGNFISNLLSTPRVTSAMAEAGALPSWFARTSARATPANSIAFMAALAAILALTGSFVELAVVSTLARLIVYLASIAALPAILNQRGERTRLDAPGLAFRAAAAGGALFCVFAIAQSTLAAWRVLAILLCVGGALYALARLRGRKSFG